METVYYHQFHAGSAGSWNLVIFGGNLVRESWYVFTPEVQGVTGSWSLGENVEEESSEHQGQLQGMENETSLIITVLEDEIKRDLYLAETLTNLEGDMDPLQSDWEL